MEQRGGGVILRARFTYVYKFKKAPYRLKQASRAWHGKIKLVLQCDYSIA